MFCDKDTQFYNNFIDPQPLTVHIDKAEQIVFEAGASRAEEVAKKVIFIVKRLFLPNERSDRFLRVDQQSHKLVIVSEPSKPANKQDKEPDITGCVFAPVAGLIPLTLVDFNQLTSDQVTAY
jgi:hypothetical protein